MTIVSDAADHSISPRVSIVTIFLNAERFLGEAIDSVLGQTFADWELLLVDDGSTDGSTEIAKRAAEKSPGRIRYVEHHEHRNLGMSASRNAGIREARGEYLAFLDSDDVYLPGRLARHVEILDAMPQVAMVQSDHIQWYSWAGERDQADDDFVRPAVAVGDRIVDPPVALLTVMAVPLMGAVPASLTARRSIVLSVGGFNDDFRDMYEDQVFTTKIYLEYRVYVLQEILVKYRRHPASWTRYLKESGQFVDGLAHPTTDAFHAWRRNYLQSRAVSHPLLQELSDLERRSGSGVPKRLRSLLTPAIGRAKVSVERRLPKGLRRTLLRWDRRRRHTRLRKLYAQFCDRLQQVELQKDAYHGVVGP